MNNVAKTALLWCVLPRVWACCANAAVQVSATVWAVPLNWVARPLSWVCTVSPTRSCRRRLSCEMAAMADSTTGRRLSLAARALAARLSCSELATDVASPV